MTLLSANLVTLSDLQEGRIENIARTRRNRRRAINRTKEEPGKTGQNECTAARRARLARGYGDKGAGPEIGLRQAEQ
jgi:hypothetical protein